MIDKEQAAKTLKLIVQNAWRLDTGNTTLNSMIEWILREYMEQVMFPYLAELEDKLEKINNSIESHYNAIDKLDDFIVQLEEKVDGQNGSIPKPKGRPATKAKRADTEARA